MAAEIFLFVFTFLNKAILKETPTTVDATKQPHKAT